MSNLKIKDLLLKHEGETVFVLGTGPTLNDVTDSQIKKIEERLSIGVNFSHMQITPTYWIAGGHATQIAFAEEYLDKKSTALFHCDPGTSDQYPQFDRINFFDDAVVSEHDLEPLMRSENYNVIRGGSNILFSASHLAYIIGAKKIVFIGFEQTNRLHFYNLWPEEKQEGFKQKLRDVAEKYHDYGAIVECVGEIFNVDEPDEQRWCHFKPIEVCEQLSFKPQEHLERNYQIFKNYVNQFLKEGVEVYTTAKEGICVEAGAKIVDLEDFLK